MTKKPALILCTYVHKRKIEMGRNCISRYVQSTPPVKGFRPFGRLAGKRDTGIPGSYTHLKLLTSLVESEYGISGCTIDRLVIFGSYGNSF